MKIVRGTTPRITAVMPEGMTLTHAKEIWISLAQGGVVLIDKTFTAGDITLAVHDTEAHILLTQEETLNLSKYQKVVIGMRILFDDGEAISTYSCECDWDCDSQPIEVCDTVKGGVIFA